ncbi:lipopolysaccharide kinase InaA family protein [Yeosuana sp. MJ-SS3]|uniref:Lipopolysaccharide kinase InaA family protein n=1 Tax=Gilvirhabdus luticola TaxID=3079858 RepID=A0ABU3U6Z0_9FLAO|nr:lipopolysaccharide kinase InaA family protein [Yeosuana sp. MJ-SS3]MDU8886107.1 lipopolysaccharide kinase InaA family protein [Yeosuana sp. MJ-SS3]
MKSVFNKEFKNNEREIKRFIKNFDFDGQVFGNQKRNTIKLFNLNDKQLNVKSFKVPNLINQIVYRFFRKSKAHRSFEYATKLLELGIGTPQPIAYFESTSFFLFKKSFYVSEHLDCDLTYRELIHDFNYPDHETILRAFTRFTYKLHENGINFLDHSPGNTLIKKTEQGYIFFLVDLNRMTFGPMSFDERMKNFARLTKYENMVKIMSDEYSKISVENYTEVFSAMWEHVLNFRKKHEGKQQLKKNLFFWRTRN